jgi:ribonucleoside-diphosphate reductase alpha chain
MTNRNRLPSRRPAESFDLEVGGLRYTATVGRFPDGTIGELFLSNHGTNRSADTAVRDGAIVLSIALQHGADLETIQRAVCRDSQGRASGPLGAALDIIMGSTAPVSGTNIGGP